MSIFKRSKPQPKAVLEENPSHSEKKSGEKGVGKSQFDVIKKVSSSEKSLKLREKNQYVFMINPHVNKKTIKDEVEHRYGVEVVKVNVIRVDDGKKALVTLAEGQKIDL